MVVMPPTIDTGNENLEDRLASIERHLQDIRHNVTDILQNVQHELEAVREREFWRDYYARTYQKE